MRPRHYWLDVKGNTTTWTRPDCRSTEAENPRQHMDPHDLVYGTRKAERTASHEVSLGQDGTPARNKYTDTSTLLKMGFRLENVLLNGRDQSLK